MVGIKRGDQNSIWSTEVESFPHCKVLREEVRRPAPTEHLLRAFVIILPAMLWRSVFMSEMIRFWQPESMCNALSN
eukprot:1146425-Pelagomonas_calceolata.AAC.2